MGVKIGEKVQHHLETDRTATRPTWAARTSPNDAALTPKFRCRVNAALLFFFFFTHIEVSDVKIVLSELL